MGAHLTLGRIEEWAPSPTSTRLHPKLRRDFAVDFTCQSRQHCSFWLASAVVLQRTIPCSAGWRLYLPSSGSFYPRESWHEVLVWRLLESAEDSSHHSSEPNTFDPLPTTLLQIEPKSLTSRDAPTGQKLFNFISISFQSRRWAHIKRSAQQNRK